MTHYLKISSSTPTGERIADFLKRCDEADAASREFVKGLGADVYYESPEGMAGGVAAIELPLDAPIPDGWELCDTPSSTPPTVNICVPSEGNDSVTKLPVVSDAEIFDILSLKPFMRKGVALPMTFGRHTPVLFFLRGFYYATSPYVSSSGDVHTISEKEFQRKKSLAEKRL